LMLSVALVANLLWLPCLLWLKKGSSPKTPTA
jgi:hypothetical protein